MSKTNLCIIGLSNQFTNDVCKQLAIKMDMFYANIEDIFAYELMDIGKVEAVCGVDYLLKEEKSIIKRVCGYDNTLINILTNNSSRFCLLKLKNDNVLNLCSENDMYTVIPNIVGNYYDVRNNLSNGSIILLDSLNNIHNIVRYIKSKGYQVVGLKELLSE